MKPAIIACLFIFFFAGVVGAEDKLFTSADANKDGKIDKVEMEKAAEKKFKEYDKNNDGFIDSEEIKAVKDPELAKEFKFMDKNSKGKVSMKEFLDAAQRRFNEYDVNRDNTLSREEFYSRQAYPQLKFYF